MNAKANFLRAEKKDIEKTLALIEELLIKDKLTQFEAIALGKLLQDAYSGCERIMRCRLLERGIKIQPSESWHKDLLRSACDEELMDEGQDSLFWELLSFRHLQIHGYGHLLDEIRLRELAAPVSERCRNFLSNIE